MKILKILKSKTNNQIIYLRKFPIEIKQKNNKKIKNQLNIIENSISLKKTNNFLKNLNKYNIAN